MFARLQSNHAFKCPTWLKPVHYMLKLSLKLAVKGQGETTNQCTPGIVCMSVQCVHGTQGEPGNEAICPQPIFIFDVSLCLCSLHECDK